MNTNKSIFLEENNQALKNIQYDDAFQKDILKLSMEDEELLDQGNKQRQDQVYDKMQKKKQPYRQKIKSLIQNDQSEQKNESFDDKISTNRKEKRGSKESRLQRNRESAKYSRQRRKEYVQLLQKSNAQNQKKIHQLKLKIKEVESERDRLKENSSNVNNFMRARSQTFDKLQKSLELSPKQCILQVNQQMKMLKTKYGVSGSERLAHIQYYMKQIMETLVDDIHKYVMECVSNDKGLFGLGQWNQLDTTFSEILDVKKQNRVIFRKNYRALLDQDFSRFKDAAYKFYEAYKNVQEQAKIIEKGFDKISLQFNDINLSKLVLWIEENKFSKEIRKMKASWIQSVINPKEVVDIVTKSHKLE